MERPTYTRKQLQDLPTVVAKRQLDEQIKRTVSFIEVNIVTEAKKGSFAYVWRNQTPYPPLEVVTEIIAQLRMTFNDDINISYIDGIMDIDWST